VAGAAILAAALIALSRERVRAAGRSEPVGRPTAIALAVAAVYTAVSLILHEAFFPLLLAGVLTVGVVVYALSGNDEPLVLAVAVPAGTCWRRLAGGSSCSCSPGASR
jgi:hypothetical protein